METTCLNKQLQLETMQNICVRMGAEITPGYLSGNYFTAAYIEDWDKDKTRVSAWAIQEKIKAIAARLPDIVCFSMDCYCTLIYVI